MFNRAPYNRTPYNRSSMLEFQWMATVNGVAEAQANIKYITMKLDENERSTQIRLMKVKDMMLEEAHHYKEREAERGA